MIELLTVVAAVAVWQSVGAVICVWCDDDGALLKWARDFPMGTTIVAMVWPYVLWRKIRSRRP